MHIYKYAVFSLKNVKIGISSKINTWPQYLINPTSLLIVRKQKSNSIVQLLSISTSGLFSPSQKSPRKPKTKDKCSLQSQLTASLKPHTLPITYP